MDHYLLNLIDTDFAIFDFLGFINHYYQEKEGNLA